jgi:hypothetical protein
MLDIAEECHVTYGWSALCRKRLARVEGSFMTAVAKEQSSTLMWRWKDEQERAKHLIAAWGIDMRLEERPFTWAATWYQME